MKYIIILGDGMADEPMEQLGGKTPLQFASTPMLDTLAERGELGMTATIPDGMAPGSDIANLAVLGYNPQTYYTGRSPLEALSIGVPMRETDVAIRCNLVSLSDEPGIAYEDRTILDHSSDEISTAEAAILLDAVRQAFAQDAYQFHVGTSYRHLFLWDKGEVVELTPPHDILTRRIGEYLPTHPMLADIMRRSFEVLNNHPLNLERARRGLKKANSCWFWGAGTRPALDNFTEKTGKKAAMVSAVDLLKGIAVGAGMTVMQVEGANGGLHTNYEGKANACLQALQDHDFCYIHVEAPDEMGHQGNVANKVLSIEYLDQRVIRPVVESLWAEKTDFRLLILPDHPTPIRLRTHIAAPIPYLLYDSTDEKQGGMPYDEANGQASGRFIEEGWKLIDTFFAN